MASIKDIAKEPGMSISTVSLALNDKPRVSKETRELVKAKAKEMQYVKNGIAADLQRKRTNLILLIVNDASRSYFAAIINQFQKATSYFGYDFLICSTYGNHIDTAKRFIEEHRADAVIIYTSTIPDEIITNNARDNFPIVVLGREVKSDNVYSFGVYDQNSTSATMDYLIKTNHKRIAFVKGSSASLGTNRSLNEYRKSLENNHLPYDPSLIFDANGASYEHGYNITKQILPLIKEIDAIQYSTDDIAIGGIMCLKEHGIHIPDDISITGKNNILESRIISPSLSTSGMVFDNYIFYESIVHFLITIIEKGENYQEISSQLFRFLSQHKDKHELIIRESTKER